MIPFIKILIFFAALLLIFYPILPWKAKRKKFSTVAALKYDKPHVRKNFAFIFVAALELIFFVLLDKILKGLGNTVVDIPVVGSFFADVISKLGSDVGFIAFTIAVLIGNVVMIYFYVILKALVKKFMDGFVYTDEEKRNLKKKKKKKRKEDETDTQDIGVVVEEDKDGKKKKPLLTDNIPVLDRTRKKTREQEKTEDNNNAHKPFAANFIVSAFFESPDYIYAKAWVRRVVSILQCFIYLTEAFFFVLLALIFVSALFPISDGIYDFLMKTIDVQNWYVYPFLSIIILQELCNTFNTEAKPTEEKKEEQISEEEQKEQDKISLRALASELKRYFDEDHKLRFYPGGEFKNTKFEYKFTNSQYIGALEYIKKKFEKKVGNRGQSYLECLDAMFNDEHVYFCASFYSEIGEYLIAYTYTRLLSGARMIFIIKDRNKRDAVRKYILSRLIQMTGTSHDVTWRVYTSEDRLDQADILVASPEDFKDDNIVENYPDFFEEVCNAVFIDADKIVSLESYICPVLAIRLLNATSDRIRFVFLSQDLIKGFAASSLPKLFCVNKVLSFSSATDNERVEYTLWNKESLKNRIYYKNGQKLMSLEGIIAEKAYTYGIDGIRLVTSSPIDHGEREILEEHGVEINEFFKDVPNINYMVYSDERCNLAAAIYACTRFKGKRVSVAQIISKPYLLREYFMSKTAKENFIKRSSFIQPRITEHAEKERLSLLKIFCRASANDGISVSEFMSEMKNAIALSRIRGDVPLCKYCAESPKYFDLEKVALKDYAAYLIAALCDAPDTKLEDSIANRAKDYYLVVDHVNHNIYSLTKEKYISFRKVKEVFEKVFACNERVVLRLNDANIGYLDTFPTRVPLEYVVGQSIVHNNVEYEIEQISSDNKIIFLRRENVTFKNCLDTIFLRRYKIGASEKIGQDGVLYNSCSKLKEIRVSMRKAALDGETYGFYNLMSNNQSLNFVRGAEGNPHLEKEVVDANRRVLQDGRMLKVTLTTDMECTDNMRILCSAVFNEFIKTIFPMAYRCIAICPVLLKPFEFEYGKEAETTEDKIATIYPYICQAEEEYVETDEHKMQFLFINDCSEDVGVFDWFYDKLASNMQEFLINVYSYLFWLKSRPDLNHYIYFGMDKMPECFDLDGLCDLLSGYNLIISDEGEKNYETASETEDEEQRRCSFCHRLMESGRYSFFDEEKTMFICADCMDNVLEEDRLHEIHNEVKKYLESNYPDIVFGFSEVVFAEENEPLSNLNEWFFRIDPDKRKIVVGYALPERDTKVAVLLGMISFWQYDNNLMNEFADAQLSFEQLKYLKILGASETADWIYSHLTPERLDDVSEISTRVSGKKEENDVENDAENSIENNAENDMEKDAETDSEEQVEAMTSFAVMRELATEIAYKDDEIDYEDIEDEDYSDGLYDPNKTPRFWKRYLKNGALDETGNESEDDEDGEDSNIIDDDNGDENNEDVDVIDDDADLDDLDSED